MLETGIKHDLGKVRPYLLFKSLNHAVQGILKVLEFGARKYTPDNWKRVVPLEERYLDAIGRHYLAIMSGEQIDEESGLPHIDHLLCSALFVSQHQKESKSDAV
jgi:hypothetical protein